MLNCLPPHGLQHARPPCPSPTPRVYSNSCPLSLWCHPTISSSVIPFSSLQSFPASGSFQMSQLFISGGQRICISMLFFVLVVYPLHLGFFSLFYQWNHLIIQKFTKAPSRLVNSFAIPSRLCCAPNNSSDQAGWKDFANWRLFTLGHFALHHALSMAHAQGHLFSVSCVLAWHLGPLCALVCLLPSSPFPSGSQFPLNLHFLSLSPSTWVVLPTVPWHFAHNTCIFCLQYNWLFMYRSFLLHWKLFEGENQAVFISITLSLIAPYS